MTKIAITPNPNGSGTFTIAAPNSNTDRTLTLPDAAGEVLTKDSSGVAAVNGVGFPTTPSPSSDPNTLDDYEEGTYTPSVTSSAGSITSLTASGSYTKIGRIVYVRVAVIISDNGTGSGALVVSLPFISAPDPANPSVGAGRENAANGKQLQWLINPLSSTGVAFTFDNAYPGGTNHSLFLSATYHA
jgi:hypothetical protein